MKRALKQFYLEVRNEIGKKVSYNQSANKSTLYSFSLEW